jgi:anti-sigma-K factor RskA
MNMDNELRDALRRKQAPADLADRVLARINEQQMPARQAAPASSRLHQGYSGQGVRRWLAAAAVLAVAAGAAWGPAVSVVLGLVVVAVAMVRQPRPATKPA